MKDATCPAIYASLEAAVKGMPFMPLRGLIGSDLVTHRPDWRVIDNPFGDDDPIVLLPAIQPDVALFHAPMADRAGNVWIGRQRDLATLAHASRETVVTVEKLHDGNLLDDPMLAPECCRASTSRRSRSLRRTAPGRCRCPIIIRSTPRICGLRAGAPDRGGFARYLDEHVYGKRAA